MSQPTLIFAARRCAFVLVLLMSLLPCAPVVAHEVIGQQGDEASLLSDADRVAPVVLDGETLFLVRGITAMPAHDRARDVRGRIITVARDLTFDPATLTIEHTDDRSYINAGGVRLVTLVDADAELEGMERHLLADVCRRNIREAILSYREQRGSDRLLSNSLLALVATAAFIGLIWLTRRLFAWLVNWAERDIKKGMDQLASKSRYILHAGQLWTIMAGVFRLVRVVIYILLTYFFLNLVLGLYPWTRPFARTLLALVLEPLQALARGFVAELPNLVFLVVLWFVVGYILKLVRSFFNAVKWQRIRLDNFEPEWAMPTFKIVRVVVIAFALVIAYPYIPGSDSLAFKGVSVFIGVLLSLGSSSFISNSIAGLTMTYRGAFRSGDLVKVGDTLGTVEDVKLLVTRVRTPKNESVIIPNSNILNTDVINYTQLADKEGLMLYTNIGIGYDVSWRQVEAMLIEAAKRTEGLDQTKEPFVLQTSLGDFAVNYQLNVFTTDPTPMARTYSALHANIQDVFNENGVQIMSPAYETDPAEPKLVPPERWYEAPAVKPSEAE